MKDKTTAFTPIDPGRVNPMDPVEMAYWCRELRCDLPTLNAAIAKVGEHVAEIRAELAPARRQGH